MTVNPRKFRGFWRGYMSLTGAEQSPVRGTKRALPKIRVRPLRCGCSTRQCDYAGRIRVANVGEHRNSRITARHGAVILRVAWKPEPQREERHEARSANCAYGAGDSPSSTQRTGHDASPTADRS